jgi:hypothetical protein
MRAKEWLTNVEYRNKVLDRYLRRVPTNDLVKLDRVVDDLVETLMDKLWEERERRKGDEERV